MITGRLLQHWLRRRRSCSALLLLACALGGLVATNSASVEDDVVCMLQLQPQLQAENGSRLSQHQKAALRPPVTRRSRNSSAHMDSIAKHHDKSIPKVPGRVAGSGPSAGGAIRSMPLSSSNSTLLHVKDSRSGALRQVAPARATADMLHSKDALVEAAAAHSSQSGSADAARVTARSAARAGLLLDIGLHSRTKAGGILGLLLAVAAVMLLFLTGWFLTHGGSWQEFKANPEKALRQSYDSAGKQFDRTMDQQFPPKDGFDCNLCGNQDGPAGQMVGTRREQRMQKDFQEWLPFGDERGRQPQGQRKGFDPNLGCC